MSATQGRNTKRRNGDEISLVVKSGTTIYAGTMVAVLTADGTAVPAGTASSGNAVGVAEDTVTGDGTLRITIRRGCFQFANSASSDLIALKDIGSIAYVAADDTVALTDGSATRVIAGSISDVDSVGVWVQIGPGAVGPQGPAGS